MNTDEFKDLTGIADRLLTLKGAIMLERSPIRMPVGISSGNVEVIQDLGFFNHVGRRIYGKLAKESRYHVPPCLLTMREVKSFHSLFCGLMGCKAGPFVATFLS